MTTPPHTQPDASQIAREIRAGLEGVTPGPWETDIPNRELVARRNGEGIYDYITHCGSPVYTSDFTYDEDCANAAHIALCSPDRIATLLDAFDAQAREIAELRGRTPDEELVDQQQAMQEEIAELREALDPFARVANINDALPPHLIPSDDVGARDYMPGVWPTVGDLRRARSVLRAKENPNG